MKTLMTVAFVAAMACTGIALGQEKPSQPETEKAADNRATIQDVKAMLEAMGYEPKPWLNNEGKLIGYTIRYESDDFTLTCQLSISPNGQNLWLGGIFGKGIDESVPAAAVLKMLELNDSIWPASVIYLPKIKTFYAQVPVQTANLTPAGLRNTLNTYTKSIKALVLGWEKATADAKAKAKESNQLP